MLLDLLKCEANRFLIELGIIQQGELAQILKMRIGHSRAAQQAIRQVDANKAPAAARIEDNGVK